MAQRAQNNGNGSTFQFNAVQTAEDIPKEIWELALPKIQAAFQMRAREVGQIPLRGGSVLLRGATTAKENWHQEFCNILRKFNGVPLVKMDDAPSAAVVARSVLPKRFLTAVPA